MRCNKLLEEYKTEVIRKLVYSMSGRVNSNSAERKKWTNEILTNNEVHPAFLDMHCWENNEKNYV